MTETPNLLQKAIDAAILLDRQLNLLLDAYDFYCERYPAHTKSQEMELVDLQASVRELGHLPKMIALTLTAWRTFMEPPLSQNGFELNVLNETAVHVLGLSRFFESKKIDLEPYSDRLIYEIIDTLKDANKTFGKVES